MLFRIEMGLQVKYIEGTSFADCIKKARADYVPEHLIRTGHFYAKSYDGARVIDNSGGKLNLS